MTTKPNRPLIGKLYKPRFEFTSNSFKLDVDGKDVWETVRFNPNVYYMLTHISFNGYYFLNGLKEVQVGILKDSFNHYFSGEDP